MNLSLSETEIRWVCMKLYLFKKYPLCQRLIKKIHKKEKNHTNDTKRKHFLKDIYFLYKKFLS